MVDWDFLMDILAARGFGPRWRGRISNILNTSGGLYPHQWNIWQLCPLSAQLKARRSFLPTAVCPSY